ncbi:MAG: heme-copper oxidase subunit III [Candidatus Rokubacteria bacterium]|nr:heme-copper oxidase subunit III [Candidatus Rokubacteria bacterium]
MTVSATTLEATPRRPPAARRTNGRVPPPPPPTGGDGDPGRDPTPRRPLLDNARLAMLFFICAEVMFFAGLVSAFLVLRLAAPVWPPPLQPRLPVAVTGVNTLVLLASSVAMVAARRALARDDRRELVRRLAVAAGLGTLFLLVQGYEWVRLVEFGLTMSSGSYGTTFYTLIGTHAAHVLGALVWLGVTLLLVARGRLGSEPSAPVRTCAMYWHFVVGLWPILYVTVYLL